MKVQCCKCQATRTERIYNITLVSPCRNCGGEMKRVCNESLPPKKKRKKKRKRERRELPPVQFTPPKYADYIQSPAWKRKRKQAFAHHGLACNQCRRSDVPLHVHHKTYARLGRERMKDLEVLCEDCHGIVHEDKYRPQDALSREFAAIVG